MIGRVYVLALTFVVGAGALGWLSRAEAAVPRTALSGLPLEIGEWRGRDNPEFDEKVVRVLGVDDYLNRSYFSASTPVSLYIGYHDTQRTGETIHSPMKCLPGTGWQPLSAERIAVRFDGYGQATRAVPINKYIVQKGTDRFVVLFWYQAHGRVIASEYVAKLRLMADAVRLNRTDGALVRVMVPIADGESDAAAEGAATRFVQQLFPLLEPHLPS